LVWELRNMSKIDGPAIQSPEEARLGAISREYLHPDPGRLVDQKIAGMIAELALPWIQGPEVLELGFGDDQWTGQIIKAFGHSHVVDASRSLLDKAKQKYGDRITTYLSLFEVFAPGPCFDTIVASGVLEHVEHPVQLLIDTAAWLRPQGNVIVIVPNADSLHRALAVCMGLQANTEELGSTDRRLGHRRVYTVATMERDIRAAGLFVAEKKGFFTKLLPQAMMTGFSDELLAGFMRLGQQLPMEFAASIAFNCKLQGER
jgi:2-polyprenyl-3-methyl-5-hydroxy-6-metoxy-1,4-benzoquinol methylase